MTKPRVMNGSGCFLSFGWLYACAGHWEKAMLGGNSFPGKGIEFCRRVKKQSVVRIEYIHPMTLFLCHPSFVQTDQNPGKRKYSLIGRKSIRKENGKTE